VLVLGLGNPILGDDAVGWRVVDAVEERLGDRPEVELDRRSVGGLALMERLEGYRAAVIVDAILGGGDPVGTAWRRPLADVVTATASHLDSSHDATLTGALRAGRAMGARLPETILVVGVTVQRVDTFGERLSPPVRAAVEPAARLVVEAVDELESHAVGRRAAAGRVP
jgi:hydrogenase maturation protease